MVCMFQEICKNPMLFFFRFAFNIVILGSEIPKWFMHQSVGNTVSAQFTHQNKNKWIGIFVCAVPMAYPNGTFMDCVILSERIYIGCCIGFGKLKSD